MKSSQFSFIAAFGLLTVVQSASAQVATPVQVAQPTAATRAASQRARIRQGVASGELTRPEAARLREHQADIRQDKQAARADGVVTRDERQDIRKDQRRASGAIYRQKHDNQERRRAR